MIHRSALIAMLLSASAGLALAQNPAPQPTPSGNTPAADQPATSATEDTSPETGDDAPPPSQPTIDSAPALDLPQSGPQAGAVPEQTVKPIRLSDLPKVLDHAGTFADAAPDENGVRRSVIMGGLDKITARTVKFEAPVGTTVRYKKLLIAARMCYVRPPEETPETSAFVEIAQPPASGGEELQRLFSGWMFASSPGLNALEHPIYDVWVIGCHVDDPKNPVVTSQAQPSVDQPAPVAAKPSIDDSIKDDDAARE